MRRVWLLPAAILIATMAGSVGASPGSQAPVPGTTCNVLPADNSWNTPVAGLPVHPKNDVWRKSTNAAGTLLHPDFGDAPYGFPFEVVGDTTPTVVVDFQYADESDAGPYPLTANTPIEGGSDRHALMISEDSCLLYELYAARWNGGDPKAGSGAIFDLNSNALRPAGWTSGDAAGLPIYPGLVRWDEVEAGSIDHAIRFTIACTRARYLWPARHHAATGGKTCPPMGARFRLRAGFDISGFGPEAQVILTAMKEYGLILADNGSDWYFQGTQDANWTDDILDELKSVPASKFVAVDVSPCRVSADSGQAVCP